MGLPIIPSTGMATIPRFIPSPTVFPPISLKLLLHLALGWANAESKEKKQSKKRNKEANEAISLQQILTPLH